VSTGPPVGISLSPRVKPGAASPSSTPHTQKKQGQLRKSPSHPSITTPRAHIHLPSPLSLGAPTGAQGETNLESRWLPPPQSRDLSQLQWSLSQETPAPKRPPPECILALQSPGYTQPHLSRTKLYHPFPASDPSGHTPPRCVPRAAAHAACHVGPGLRVTRDHGTWGIPR
jgi:hypothetical protein